MTESPRPHDRPSKPESSSKPELIPLSGPMLIFMTALDTTWRMFIPTLAGTFIGIGLDSLFHIAPIATIICLLLGVGLSFTLVFRQLKKVRTKR